MSASCTDIHLDALTRRYAWFDSAMHARYCCKRLGYILPARTSTPPIGDAGWSASTAARYAVPKHRCRLKPVTGQPRVAGACTMCRTTMELSRCPVSSSQSVACTSACVCAPRRLATCQLSFRESPAARPSSCGGGGASGGAASVTATTAAHRMTGHTSGDIHVMMHVSTRRAADCLCSGYVKYHEDTVQSKLLHQGRRRPRT